MAGGFPSTESYSHLLGHWCRSWHPLMVGAVHSLSGQWGYWGYLASAHSFGRSSQCPSLKPKTHTHTWSTCRQCPIVWQCSVKEDFYGGPFPLCVCLPIMLLYLSGRHRFLFQLHPQLPQFDLFKLFPHLSLGLNSGAWTSGPDPHPSNRAVCQVGENSVAVPPFCAGYSPFCLPQAGYYSLLLGSKFPLRQGLSPWQWGNLPRCRKLSCFTAPSLRCRPHYDSFCFFFLLSYSVMRSFSCCFIYLTSSVSAQKLLCVTHFTCWCIFNVSVKEGELCFLLLCHLDLSPIVSWF